MSEPTYSQAEAWLLEHLEPLGATTSTAAKVQKIPRVLKYLVDHGLGLEDVTLCTSSWYRRHRGGTLWTEALKRTPAERQGATLGKVNGGLCLWILPKQPDPEGTAS